MNRSHPAGTFATRLLTLPVALLALVVGVAPISAAEPLKLGLTPVGVAGSNFSLTMQPGESRDLSVQLVNHGSDSVIARTFAADGYSMVNGGLAVRLDGEPTGGTTGWLTYSKEDLELTPGVAIQRPFTIAVPDGTAPGEYVTSIVLQNVEPTSGDASGQGGVMLKQIIRQVVAVSIDVPGPRTPALELGPISHQDVARRSMFLVAVQNLGNVRLAPVGEFWLWDSTGAEVTRFPIVMDTVYAHTDTHAEIPFAERLKPGAYTAELRLSDASGVAATSGRLLLTVPDAVAPTPPSSAPDAVPSRAQTVQPPVAPVVEADPGNPWMMATIAFGAGMGLMLAAGGIIFVVYRRRRAHGQP